MKKQKETLVPVIIRFNKAQRKKIKTLAKEQKVSEAAIVRLAVDELAIL